VRVEWSAFQFQTAMLRQLVTWCCWGSAFILRVPVARGLEQQFEAYVGDARVQALSPTLVRIERKGPRGFEDRTTFTVVSRDFPGIHMEQQPLDAAEGTVVATKHYQVRITGNPTAPDFMVLDPNGGVLFDSVAESGEMSGLLHWPPPLKAKSYGLMDYPRFYVPPWGPTPIPSGAKVDPALLATNGYDFRNNVKGDFYIFLLGNSLASWSASRKEFLKLAGPCPVIPDFAFGTWFTWWHQYTETEAEKDIAHWEREKFPLDVWGLDMNWRNTSHNQDHFYDHPDTALIANFSDWFQYLKSKKLRTYFNDHPFPVASRDEGGLQTSPQEVAFRWQGVSKWLSKGLTFWWFDRNWGFSIPPPFVNTSKTGAVWEGLDNAAWGSHVYYTSVKIFDREHRDKVKDRFYGGRPMTLTKFAAPDWVAGMDPRKQAESPSQHRYPIWWTGDDVTLHGSVESMVNAGVYDIKPYVHSDCGSDWHSSGGSFLRWTAHCVFGTIVRYHSFHGTQRPWSYNNHTQNVFRKYLDLRYRMLPHLIAAGFHATESGHPLVARGDLFWPELAPCSARSDQYIFLNHTLVAPIYVNITNITSRSVWIPPGEWQDVWDGSIIKGPKIITATQPYERQPMWHRMDGGLLVMAEKAATRVEDQDWSSLVLEAFPAKQASRTQQSVHERSTGARTGIELVSDGMGEVRLHVSEAEDGAERSWLLRLHLRPGQLVSNVMVDDVEALDEATHIHPVAPTAQFFLLEGAGAPPAPKAGHVVEIRLPRSSGPRKVTATVNKVSSLRLQERVGAPVHDGGITWGTAGKAMLMMLSSGLIVAVHRYRRPSDEDVPFTEILG